MGTEEHKSRAPLKVTIGIFSMSSTRSIDEDISGKWIRDEAEKLGHEVVLHKVIDDDMESVSDAVISSVEGLSPDILLLTGGTGIAPKDVTVEAVKPLFSKELTAFGVLFSQLSYEEIGSAAILSRATAGIINRTIIFSMPGSLKACQLACSRLIFPELGHLVKHSKKE